MAETTLTPPAQPVNVGVPTDTVAPPLERPVVPHRRPFSADEFERMAEVGILRDDERVELIDGEIIAMSRIGSPHSACVSRVTYRLPARLTGRAIVRVQDPVRLGELNEPEPDFSIVALREDFYQSGHPTPVDIFFVIEVMDTSAHYDRTVKLPLYAAAGIPEVWLVDLANALLEVHRRPLNGQYAAKATYAHGQQVAPEAFPDVVLDVDSILSRPQETP